VFKIEEIVQNSVRGTSWDWRTQLAI